MQFKRIAVVGAGLSGSVIARKLAEFGCEVDVFDVRGHIGGNCYTERKKDSGIVEHIYGPHIFHTSNDLVWEFMNRYLEMMPYINRVKTTYKGEVYSLPINLHTINQFFSKEMSPSEARLFISKVCDSSIDEPQNFEEQALKFVGRDLYEAFFEGYTKKQWGVNPAELPASILKRLPVRFNYNDNYFSHKYQGMPREGYTELFEKLLDHENIHLTLAVEFLKVNSSDYDHVFYSGPIDKWFDYSCGRLGYRTLDFERTVVEEDFQGCAVMNFASESVPYTRISQHDYFSPWEESSRSVIYKETSRLAVGADVPYYPIRLVNEKKMLEKYIALAESESSVSFIGRLGTYRYLDMDVTIGEALLAGETAGRCFDRGESPPAFFQSVL